MSMLCGVFNKKNLLKKWGKRIIYVQAACLPEDEKYYVIMILI